MLSTQQQKFRSGNRNCYIPSLMSLDASTTDQCSACVSVSPLVAARCLWMLCAQWLSRRNNHRHTQSRLHPGNHAFLLQRCSRHQPDTMAARVATCLVALISLMQLVHAIRPHAAPQQQVPAPNKHKELNNRPIVGILTQAGLEEDKFVPKDGSYIASSYVKFVEAGGARVVPILADTPEDILEGLLDRLNGVLIPGGAGNLRPGHDFYDTAKRVLDHAIRSNDAGRYFPIMGICLGFETLMVLTAGTHEILRPYDSDGMAAQLFFTAAAPDSRFWQSWDLDLVFDVLQTPLTRESHSSGVSLTDFYRNQKLKDFLNPLTLSLDKEGKVYISTVEAKNYPIIGLQWHPEKNSFEWTKHKNIPHGYWSSEVTHQTVRFFINETRKSLVKFNDVVDEDIWLIYNDKIVFSGRHIHEDDPVWAEQAVVFPSWREYSRDLENRAALADRRWLDSIDGPDSNAENKYYNQMQQQEKKIGIGKLITS